MSQIVLTLGGTEEGRALYSFGMIVVEENWQRARRRAATLSPSELIEITLNRNFAAFRRFQEQPQ